MVSHGVFTIVDISDGAQWYSGVNITGNSVTPTIFLNSGITYAVEGDMYLNTSTQNIYRCVESGDSSSAKWVYVNNIKGDTGKGISSIKSQYYLHTSDTNRPADNVNWEDAPPNYQENYYYWTRSYITWSDGSSPTTTTPVLDMALTNANKNAVEAKEEAEDAKKIATNYLSIDSTGIMVANMKDGEQKPSKATGRNVFIDNNSVNIRNGTLILASFTGDNTKFYDPVYQKELATFGTSGAIIGANNEQRFVIEKDSVSAINENGALVFSIVSTNKTFETEAVAAPAGEVDAFTSGSTITLDVGDSVSENTFYIKNISVIIAIQGSSSVLNNVKVNSVNADVTRFYFENGSYDYPPYSQHSIIIPESPAFSCNYGASKTVTYEITANFTNDYNDSYNLTCNFTLTYNGERTLNLSILEGACTRTSGNNGGEASFDNFGSKYTYTSVISSTAYTKAPAMTFGTRKEGGINAPLSVTIGQSLYANNDNQLSIGRYNLNNDEFFPLAFVIGNGSSDMDRSNAFSVDWDGNTIVEGNLEVNGDTTLSGALSVTGNITSVGQIKGKTETYSLTLPSTVSFGGGLVRNGGVAMLSIINISKLPAGQTTLCTLPEGWRPPVSVMSKFEAPDNSKGPVRLFINSSGVVTLYNYGAAITSASNISDTITYVLA